MSIKFAIRLASALALLVNARVLVAQDTKPMPLGVDKASIAAGKLLYGGSGQCAACHGANGEGTPEGPSLIAGHWEVADGSFASLLHVARHAGWGSRSRDGDPQPMRGPTMLDSAEVRRVAAYVYSISRQKVMSGTAVKREE
jgi:mono/diheme cytochrome c family protein